MSEALLISAIFIETLAVVKSRFSVKQWLKSVNRVPNFYNFGIVFKWR